MKKNVKLLRGPELIFRGSGQFLFNFEAWHQKLLPAARVAAGAQEEAAAGKGSGASSSSNMKGTS